MGECCTRPLPLVLAIMVLVQAESHGNVAAFPGNVLLVSGAEDEAFRVTSSYRLESMHMLFVGPESSQYVVDRSFLEKFKGDPRSGGNSSFHPYQEQMEHQMMRDISAFSDGQCSSRLIRSPTTPGQCSSRLIRCLMTPGQCDLTDPDHFTTCQSALVLRALSKAAEEGTATWAGHIYPLVVQLSQASASDI